MYENINFENMMKVLEKETKHDINYFLKHNIKSPNLSKIQMAFKQDNEDFKDTCLRLKSYVQGA